MKKPMHLAKTPRITACGITFKYCSKYYGLRVRNIRITAADSETTCKRCLKWIADPWEAREGRPVPRIGKEA